MILNAEHFWGPHSHMLLSLRVIQRKPHIIIEKQKQTESKPEIETEEKKREKKWKIETSKEI